MEAARFAPGFTAATFEDFSKNIRGALVPKKSVDKSQKIFSR